MNSVHLPHLRPKTGRDAVGARFLKSRERKCSFSLDFRLIRRRFSTEQEVKLFYAARATRRRRFGGVLTTPRGRDLFLLVLIFG